jgi:hypothetical protein
MSSARIRLCGGSNTRLDPKPDRRGEGAGSSNWLLVSDSMIRTARLWCSERGVVTDEGTVAAGSAAVLNEGRLYEDAASRARMQISI